jgi:hypothetical protein
MKYDIDITNIVGFTMVSPSQPKLQWNKLLSMEVDQQHNSLLHPADETIQNGLERTKDRALY